MSGRAMRVLVVLLLGASPVVAQQLPGAVDATACPTPAVASATILAAETLAGAAAGLFASWGLAYAGAAVLGPRGGEDPGLAGALTGFFVGAAVGTALGVHLTARAFGLPARYYEALGGALAGALSLGVIPLDADRPSFWLAVYGMPTLGAVLASTLGSQSRVRPVAWPTGDGLEVGLRVAF